MRARRRTGMERIELDDDYARIEALGSEAPALAPVERLAPRAA
jgi:hypothetical protein